MKKFAIVGGGIGGLTTAIALQRKGFDVTVYESASEIKPLGAGIVLAANAIKAYQALGIADDILSAGTQVKLLQIKNQKGAIITEVNAEKFSANYGINNFTIHRADLHAVLLSQLTPGTLQKNKTCIDFTQHKNIVSLNFSDGTSDWASYIIACDGIHSVIRKKLVPESLPRFAGYTCWRAVINECPDNVDFSVNSETWGADGRFGLVPLRNKSLYWFACINTRANDPMMRSFQQKDLLRYFEKFHNPIPDVIRRTRNEQLLWNDILDLKPLNKFAYNNIVLLGDAAHATTPNMGQGACMAIEDAVILANCIVKNNSLVERAFVVYESLRLGRTAHIINASRRMGAVAQLENKFLIGLRNTILKLTPQKVAEKQLQFIYNISFQ